MTMSEPVCLIAGVGPGTGAECARRFARGGYRVAMLACGRERLEALEADIAGARSYPCDVSDLDGLVDTVARVSAEIGPTAATPHVQ